MLRNMKESIYYIFTHRHVLNTLHVTGSVLSADLKLPKNDVTPTILTITFGVKSYNWEL